MTLSVELLYSNRNTTILVSCGRCNQLSQICWLKTINSFSHSFQARVQNWAEIRMLAEPHSGDCGRISHPCYFQLLVAAGISWLVAASLQPTSNLSLLLRITFVCVCVCVYVCVCEIYLCLSLIETLVVAFRAYMNNPG